MLWPCGAIRSYPGYVVSTVVVGMASAVLDVLQCLSHSLWITRIRRSPNVDRPRRGSRRGDRQPSALQQSLLGERDQ